MLVWLILNFNVGITDLPPLPSIMIENIFKRTTVLHLEKKMYVRATSQLFALLLVYACRIQCGPIMSTGLTPPITFDGCFIIILRGAPDWHARPREEAQPRERYNVVAHSETVVGRMGRGPAELSIQSSLCRGQNGQEGGTPRGN